MSNDAMPDFREQWPELFADLTVEQRDQVLQTVANSFLDRASYSREDIAALCAVAVGKLSVEQAIRDQRPRP